MGKQHITLYEPIIIMWLFITTLSMLFSGTLFTSIYNGSQRECQKKNVQLLMEQREGPLRKCEL